RSAAWRCSKTARRTSACAGPPRHAAWNSPPSESCPATRGCIRTCWVIDVLRLVRAHNLVVAAAGVLAGGWIALGTFATPKLLVFAAVAGVGFGAAGNAMNDIWDAAADRVNRSPAERPFAARRLSRVTADLCVVGGILLGLWVARCGAHRCSAGRGVRAREPRAALRGSVPRRLLCPRPVRPGHRAARREPAHHGKNGAEQLVAQRSDDRRHRVAGRGEGGMTLWQGVVLGLVQGLTEFLPVSSSGHLAGARALIGLRPDDET